MSLHSYSCCWLHLIWATLKREPILTKDTSRLLVKHLIGYAKQNGIYMKTCFANADHVHALIDLPTHYSIEQVMKLLKGESSHWLNGDGLLEKKFSWGRGYGAFSVSQSNVDTVIRYINNQAKHHEKKPFMQE